MGNYGGDGQGTAPVHLQGLSTAYPFAKGSMLSGLDNRLPVLLKYLGLHCCEALRQERSPQAGALTESKAIPEQSFAW